MSDLVVGTAGWSLPLRMADAFPTPGSHLCRYAGQLPGVEINSSFHRPHRRTTYARWAETVPDRFRFAVKVPRAITHLARLADCTAALDRFADEIAGLGGKLGPILVQLPPSLAYEAPVAQAFFALLRERVAAPLACEPRHAGWFSNEAEALLVENRVARVAADPAPVPEAADPGGWSGLTYLRMHGVPRLYASDYDAAALAMIAARCSRYRTAGPVWCIFDNTAAGHAIGNALAVTSMTAPGRRRTQGE